MPALELFSLGASSARSIAASASRAEAAGWHGLAVVDSQNLAGDAWVALSIAAAHTERLLLATGVTNPVTRHPAVAAAAAASLQVQSNGRTTLGIGRGDSSLAHLGRSPASVGTLEQYLGALQTYLRGESLPFEALDFHPAAAPAVAELGLADTPEASRLLWLDPALPKVPVEVAATGPRVIAAAARHADRVMFALGADPDRIAWGIETARKARGEAGMSEGGLAFGAFVNLVCHPDLAVARRLVSGGLSTFARFAVMHGTVAGPASEAQREVLSRVHAAYDMKSHTRVGAPQAEALTPEFIERYAVVGSPARCVERLRELADLGLSRITVIGPTAGADREAARTAERMLAAEVLPAFAR
jgi:5,10-methylenetetrahydromethanopterin reductase